MKYRKKPVIVDAYNLLLDAEMDDSPKWIQDAVTGGSIRAHSGRSLLIRTLEGDMVAMHGDWIIRGVQGELYPCKPDIFEQTYEPVEDDA